MVSSELLKKCDFILCTNVKGLIMFHAVSDEFNTLSLFLSMLKTQAIHMLIARVTNNRKVHKKSKCNSLQITN